MDKFHRSQAAKLLLLTIFSMCIAFMPSTVRSFYLYFLLNLLILVLAMEAGVLSAPSTNEPSHGDDIKPTTTTTTHVPAAVSNFTPNELEHPLPEKVTVSLSGVQRLIMSTSTPSTPSLFFIGDIDVGGSEGDDDVDDECVLEDGGNEYDDDDDEQALFARAETFITNFHKQLKMQREGSWKKIRDL